MTPARLKRRVKRLKLTIFRSQICACFLLPSLAGASLTGLQKHLLLLLENRLLPFAIFPPMKTKVHPGRTQNGTPAPALLGQHGDASFQVGLPMGRHRWSSHPSREIVPGFGSHLAAWPQARGVLAGRSDLSNIFLGQFRGTLPHTGGCMRKPSTAYCDLPGHAKSSCYVRCVMNVNLTHPSDDASAVPVAAVRPEKPRVSCGTPSQPSTNHFQPFTSSTL